MARSTSSSRRLASCAKAQSLILQAKSLEREAELLRRCATLEAELSGFRSQAARAKRTARRHS